eukprot:192825-Ditylum_brightwellii.AAC.1
MVRQAHNKRQTTIKYKNLYTPHTALGHHKAPGGANVSQKNALQKKSERYAIKASTSALKQHKAKMYYNSCYIKSVGYVLGRCFFSQTELEEIERYAIRVFTS